MSDDDDARHLGRLIRGMTDYNRIAAASAPSARLLERDGVVAAIMPATPARSALNAVVYERSDALAGALDEIAAAYAEAAVRAWMVWVPATDVETARLLDRSGHRRVESATAMARDLRGFKPPPGLVLEAWTAVGAPAAMGSIADAAFGFGDAFALTFLGLPQGAEVYLASVDGEPVSCLVAHERDENRAVDLVATLPAAQGRSISTALLAQALADGAARGCTTATLVATRQGRPVYERLGYHAIGRLDQWERTA